MAVDSSDSDDTVPVSTSSQEFQNSPLEIWLRSGAGSFHVFPVLKKATTLGPQGPGVDIPIDEPVDLSLTLRDNQLFFHNHRPEFEITQMGQIVVMGKLEIGATLHIGRYSLQLWDRDSAVAYLKGFNGAYNGHIWLLQESSYKIGRSGRRANDIVLEDSTVSREHATLTVDSGSASLVAESKTSLLSVNGKSLEAGETHSLQDNDILDLGQLIFRFRRNSVERDSQPRVGGSLHVRSLGLLRVRLGALEIDPAHYRTQNVKWLMGRLAYAWQKGVPMDTLLNMFWPEADETKARSNLNVAVSTLRLQLMGNDKQQVNPILRSSQVVQLNPDILGEHDFLLLEHELEACRKCRERGEDFGGLFLSALRRYDGPYLDGCYHEWVTEVRDSLEFRVGDYGRTLLEICLQREQFDEILEIAPRILATDPYCQVSCAAAMRAHCARGEAHLALKLYERCRKSLEKDLQIEPSVDVMREYHRAKT